MSRVRTAVVPAAGLGTRFLPTTLAVPKELLPLERRPAIHHIVAEAVACGIEKVVLVLSQGKESILHYFLDNPVVARGVKKPEHERLVEEVRELGRKVELVAVYQEEALGLGHAVLMAAPVVGSDPFALMLPDDHFRPSPLASLVKGWAEKGLGGIALKEVSPEEVSRYGIVKIARREAEWVVLDGCVEKPSPDEAPSNLGIMGRYVLPGRVFELLQNARPTVKGEIQITDSLARIAEEEGLLGVPFTGTYLDLGTWEGYVQANVWASAQDPALAAKMRQTLQRSE